MATRLEKLLFAIGVKDDGASNKISRLQKSIKGVGSDLQSHFAGIGMGAAGVWGAVKSIGAIAEPAIDLNRALSDIGALGVDAAGLKHLQSEAGKFAMTYGGTAADVVRSSYDIQSAIDGLSAQELASFTTSAGLLAKASKSDIGNMTAYMGTMYGIFEKNAAAMGKSAWSEQVAAQTVYIANKYKSSGESMSAAFTSLGANAQAAGIEVAEQMAVLGLLQKTMPGPESGTKYKAFLAGVGKAQDTLGMKFTDSQGKMLAMPEILEKLKGKFGNLDKVADADLLKKAFGSAEAVSLIKLLLPQLDEMKNTIGEVRGISDLSEARDIAKQTTDSFQRFGGALNYVLAAGMQKVLPTYYRWTDKGTEILSMLGKWVDKFPNVARVVGYVATAILAVAGVSALGVAGFHLYRLSAMALGGPFKGLLALTKLLGAGFLKLAAALWANPIILIVLGIALAIGLVIYYWDELKAAFADSAWGAPFLFVMEKLEEKWRLVTDLFRDFSWTKLLETAVSLALTPLEVFINAIGKLLDMAGFDMGQQLMGWKAQDLFKASETAAPPGTATATAMTAAPAHEPWQGRGMLRSLSEAREARPPEGGIAGQTKNIMKNTGTNIHIGEQHNHFPENPENQDDMAAKLYG